MQYERYYRVIRTDGSVVEGQYIQTRGDDENYPTFVLADGLRLGVHKDAVLGPVIDDCPVDGITRPDPGSYWYNLEQFPIVKDPSPEVVEKIIRGPVSKR
jgi:hypothetical protein